MDSLLKKITAKFVKFESVQGLDASTSKFLKSLNAESLLQLRTEYWQHNTLMALACMMPLILVERGKGRKPRRTIAVGDAAGEVLTLPAMHQVAEAAPQKEDAVYEVLGAGLSWSLAKHLYAPGDLVPAMVIEARRISQLDKLDFVAAELLGMPALFNLGKAGPRIRKEIWQHFIDIGHSPTSSTAQSAFNKATKPH